MPRPLNGWALAVGLLLGGCGQAQELVADWLKPPSAAEIGARMSDLARSGQTAEALRKGEAWLARHPDPQDDLHRLLAQLYTEAGDSPGALRHLERIGAAKAATAVPQPAAAVPPDAAPVVPATPTEPTAPTAPTPPTSPTAPPTAPPTQ